MALAWILAIPALVFPLIAIFLIVGGRSQLGNRFLCAVEGCGQVAGGWMGRADGELDIHWFGVGGSPNAMVLKTSTDGKPVTDTELAKRLKGINLYLIGMMGAGKSTIGHLLAQHLEYRFFDTDILIERVKQQSIAEIFQQEGEASFRALETQVLAELSACTRSVIATGGGIVLAQQNWSYLQEGLVIWLDVPVPELAQRLQADTTRPLLTNGTDPIAKLESLFEQRSHRYAQADLRIIITPPATPEAIAAHVLAQIPTVLKPTT